MDSEFRTLQHEERDLLVELLHLEFPGRDELLSQLDHLAAKQVLEDGTLLLKCSAGAPALAARGLAAEGKYKDLDGLDVDVLLHVNQEGYMHMLEIVKAGPDPVIEPPRARNLVITKGWPRATVYDSEAG